MLEKNFQRHLTRIAKSKGAVTWVNMPTYACGVPDVTIIYNGDTWHVELKVDNRQMTPLQATFARRIHAAGGYHMLLRHKDNKVYATSYPNITSVHEWKDDWFTGIFGAKR